MHEKIRYIATSTKWGFNRTDENENCKIKFRRQNYITSTDIKLQIWCYLQCKNWMFAWNGAKTHHLHHQHLHLSLNARVVGAPQMISQPVFSIFPCSPLPFGTCRTPGLSISWCCLPTSSSVCLVFFPLSLYLARLFLPDLMNGRHDHTTAVCVSLRWSGDLCVVQLPARSWHRLPLWWHGLCMRCVVSHTKVLLASKGPCQCLSILLLHSQGWN